MHWHLHPTNIPPLNNGKILAFCIAHIYVMKLKQGYCKFVGSPGQYLANISHFFAQLTKPLKQLYSRVFVTYPRYVPGPLVLHLMTCFGFRRKFGGGNFRGNFSSWQLKAIVSASHEKIPGSNPGRSKYWFVIYFFYFNIKGLGVFYTRKIHDYSLLRQLKHKMKVISFAAKLISGHPSKY